MGESQNGCFKKQSTPNVSKSEHFLPPDTHTYVCVSTGKKCLFYGKFGELCFLETPILRFTLLPYYRRISIARDLFFFPILYFMLFRFLQYHSMHSIRLCCFKRQRQQCCIFCVLFDLFLANLAIFFSFKCLGFA